MKAKRAKTQKAYIKALTPTNFGFIGRIPFMLSVIFVCMTLSTGFPLLIPICSVCFFIMFLVEKKIFISYSKKPPIYNDKITKVVIRSMLISLVLHCAFAIFIYGEPELFTYEMTIQTIDGEVSLQEMENNPSIWVRFYHRIKLSPFFVILLFVVIFFIILDFFINSVFGSSLRKKCALNINNEITENYFENFKILNYNDFPKYDFRLTEE